MILSTNIMMKILIIFMGIVWAVMIISVMMKTISIKTLEKIVSYESELFNQLSDNGKIKNTDDRNKYIEQMEEYLMSNKSKLFIWKIHCNSDSITIQLYTGVHYTIFPQVKWAK